MKIVSTLLLVIGSVCFAQAQTSSPFIKFGKITVEELQKKQYAVDSNASAVVLSDIGNSAIEGNNKGGFSVRFTRHRVVHILNKNGYDEADVSIRLYTRNSDDERLENLKAITYNLENGKIVESKLDKSSVFREKEDDHWFKKKFTFPNVKEGCIIEYEYATSSPYIDNLDPWYFQGSSPVLWSELTLAIPQFFSYSFLSRGFHSLFISDRQNRQESFMVRDSRGTEASETVSFVAGVTDYRWVMKDVPELREESFTSSIRNHISRIEFQLASQSEPLTPRNFRTSWTMLTKELMDADFFASNLKGNNNWLSDDVKPVVAKSVTETDKAKMIFEFVRDNISCTGNEGIGKAQTLKNVMKARKGSVAEVNLLLTAMLRNAGINSSPVLVSTRSHGYALEQYPMITSFNYVVTQAEVDGKTIYLDATEPRLGFGRLPVMCYNGHARVVNEQATPVQLSTDSIQETEIVSLIFSNDEKGNYTGHMTKIPGYYASNSIRNNLKEKGMETYFASLKKNYGEEVSLKNLVIDSVSQYELPVSVQYDLDLSNAKEDILYINPMFGEGFKTNPFKSAERFYPVEMPYKMDETFLLTMEVPAGYVVDELPKQIIAKMDEAGSAYFEYRITHSGSTISLRSRMRITRTLYMPDEYEGLREFFNLIVSKHNEQIVFKKKK